MARSEKLSQFDVLVVGAGPAGLTIANECARAGLRVGCIDRDIDAPWPNQYGVWCDEWDQTRYSEYLTHRWERSIFVSSAYEVDLHRTYGRVDRARLKAQLLRELAGFEGVCMKERAASISRDAECSTVELESGHALTAALVIDACGFTPLRDGVDIYEDPSIAWQTAWGELIRVRNAPEGLLTAFQFMDFRCPETATDSWHERPSFLYSMPFDEEHVFVEETSLAALPELPMETLRHRLQLRLDWMGVEVVDTLEVERCRLPMNMPMSRPQTTCLRWGAAAGMIHPATGYMVSAMVRRSPDLAKAIAIELRADSGLTDEGLRRLHDAVWPLSLRKARDLHMFGMNEVLTMDLEEQVEFFRSFFALPEHHWRCYLDSTSSHREITGAMFRLFITAPASMKARMVKAGFRRPMTILTSM